MLTRGKLARLAGIGPETIRFYEEKGILPKPSRNHSGYRTYKDDTVRTLKFVKRAKALGFSLKDIEALLKLSSSKKANCSQVKEKALLKRAEIKDKIDSLKKMDFALTKFIEACSANKIVDFCPLLAEFKKEYRGKNENQ